MKKVYNKFIEWTFSIIALLLYIPLITVKLTMKVVVKIARAIMFVVDEVFTAIVRITEGLEERLGVKDWLGFRRVWELVRVWGALPPSLLLSLSS